MRIENLKYSRALRRQLLERTGLFCPGAGGAACNRADASEPGPRIPFLAFGHSISFPASKLLFAGQSPAPHSVALAPLSGTYALSVRDADRLFASRWGQTPIAAPDGDVAESRTL